MQALIELFLRSWYLVVLFIFNAVVSRSTVNWVSGLIMLTCFGENSRTLQSRILGLGQCDIPALLWMRMGGPC